MQKQLVEGNWFEIQGLWVTVKKAVFASFALIIIIIFFLGLTTLNIPIKRGEQKLNEK